jgi:hypothetical protein
VRAQALEQAPARVTEPGPGLAPELAKVRAQALEPELVKVRVTGLAKAKARVKAAAPEPAQRSWYRTYR